ncbi:GntR family transcriptional regulator [Streptomyces flavidovirens]|uniref:GntR family transcriptional regulator n=1 Tax=Streptomyces flavidovirens TaxID=67298 RepID=UPI00041E689D|nr:GntR family transcriptional regulator [Streptomyces flavidovirens]
MTLPLEDDSRPPYVQVADYLRRKIQSGELGPGDKVPSSRELQEQFGLASATVQNAFRMLKTEGLIYSIQGRGSFIRRPSAEGGTPAAGSGEGDASADASPLTPDEDRYMRLSMEVEDLKFQLAGMKQDMAKMFTLMQKMADHIDGQENQVPEPPSA